MVVTLLRLGVTHRRLLQWETAASSTARSVGLSSGRYARSFLEEMAASPALALVALIAVIVRRPSALPVALPILVLWFTAPLIAAALSKPPIERPQRLSLDDRRTLRLLARKTWRYFESFIGPQDNHLPPDNVQEMPWAVAHRTSPTNIGMGLLSTLAAHDLGFIASDELVSRLENTLSTVERLEHFEGHLLNWYDTRSLAPLLPRYISTVDSGNLAGALMALSVGLRQLESGRLCWKVEGSRPSPTSPCSSSERCTRSARLVPFPVPSPHCWATPKRSSVFWGMLSSLAQQPTSLRPHSMRRLSRRSPPCPPRACLASKLKCSTGVSNSPRASNHLSSSSPSLRLHFADALEALAARALALADRMNFGFLYNPQLRLLTIGYRLGDPDEPDIPIRRTTICWPRNRGWPVSSPSPREMSPKSIGFISVAW